MDDSFKTVQLDTSKPPSSSHSYIGTTLKQQDLIPTSADLLERLPGVATLLSEFDNEQKADLALFLLQTIPRPHMNRVLHQLDTHSRNLLETLPQELVIAILCHLNVTTLLEMSLVSRHWYTLCQDSVIWRYLFEGQGWGYDGTSMEQYLAKDSTTHYTIPSKQLGPLSPLLLQSTPIVRSSGPLQQRRLTTTTSPNNISTTILPAYLPKPRKPLLLQKVASGKTRPPIPPHPSHQHLLPHYDVKSYTRFIDWKSLYRHRHKIAEAWRSGRYRPYRFRSDPASLRRQQQEENSDGENTLTATSTTPIQNNDSIDTTANLAEGSISTPLLSPEQVPSTTDEQQQQQRRQHQQQQRDQHQDAVYSLALDPTHHTIFSASRDQTLKEWHFDHAVATLQHTYTDLHQGSILCLDLDDRYLVTGSKDRTVVQTDRWRREKVRTLGGHQDSVLNVVLDGDWIYSASKDRTIKIWSSATGELVRTLRGHREAVNVIKVHQDRIVSASGDRTIKLWDRDTGDCLLTFLGHEGAISCLDFDGTSIVSGSKDKSIIIWDLSGHIIRKFYAHTGLVRTLQLQSLSNHHQTDHSPSESLAPRIIVSAGYNDNINVWNFETGQLLHTFPRYYPGRIINLRFDNMKIVLGLDSGDIVVYDFAFGLDTRFIL
ncbi:WD40-repeat-containing domain protein [Chlamydoabsidia padenii]|nr:WD40-repeat-containing domain protein [Chlamydoabsidia padenii]